MTELLKKLMMTPGVSGREYKIREVIRAEADKYADEVITDPMGNLIARKKGSGKKIMLVAHMDEIGYFATYIDGDGLVHLGAVGGINPLSSSFDTVVSEKGVCGVAVPPDNKEMPKTDKLCVDIGARTRKQAEARVSIGDFFVHSPRLKRLAGNRYIGRPFDDRVGCLVLLEALKSVKNTENDLYFVFSVQEEVGSRGAKPAAYGIEPDVGIAVDVTTVSGKPAPISASSVKLGNGAAIKIKDSSVICSYELVEIMKRLSSDRKIKCQDEIILAGGTDTSVIQVAKLGCMAGAISIPTAYIHTVNEMIDMGDVREAVKLACALCEEI